MNDFEHAWKAMAENRKRQLEAERRRASWYEHALSKIADLGCEHTDGYHGSKCPAGLAGRALSDAAEEPKP